MFVELTFTELLLGTLSGDKELATDFIASKHPEQPQEDEAEAIASLPEALEKCSTVFPKDESGVPYLWDYQIKGFFKDACEALIHTEQWTKDQLKRFRLTQYLHRKTVDQLVFVYPRKIPLVLNGDLDFCERPLRGQTMKGERIALARSEAAPAGTKILLEIRCMNDNLAEWITRWLNYGALRGLGQWRNSGMGRFTWQEVKATA